MNTGRRLTVTGMVIAALLWSAVGLDPGTAFAAPAQPADSFVESIGVNVHLGYAMTPYVGRLPEVEGRLVELGIRHVRTGFVPGSAEIDSAVRGLAGDGIDTTLIMGSPKEASGALPQMLSEVKTSLLGSVDALEGPNEYSTSGDSEWKAHLVAYQERLYREVNEDPQLAALPVIGPSIVHNDQANLGDISSFLDLGNIHSYPEGGPPEEKLDYYLQRATLNSAAKPVMATETGYTNATNWTPPNKGENRPITEAGAATYLPRLYLEYWARGIGRTFAYELLDEHPDPGLGEREEHFGLLRNDLSPKPAATAIENLTSLLADPGPEFAPASLEYTLAGGIEPVKSVLLEKRDGSFYLALWRQQSVWNPETKREIPAPAEPLEVTFPTAPLDYSVYEPTVSAAPLTSGGPTQSLTVDVGPGVTILRLVPPPPPPPIAAVPPALANVLPLPLRTSPRCTVAALKGLMLVAAEKKLRAAHCRPQALAVKTRRRRPAGASAPRVTRVEPKAGTVMTAGAKVKVFYRRPARG